MAIDKKTYALANSYTDETVIGGGAIKGKNCTISKIEEIEGGNRITFSWTLDNGTTKTQTLDVKDGEDGYTPIKDVDYFDGEKGDKGDAGNGITTITKTSTAGIVDTYTILFDDGDTTTFNVVNGANITKVSELENDEEFVKATTISLVNYYLKDEAYSKAQIDELLRNVGAGLSVKIVTELPTTEISGTTIYLINTSGSNYNQYMYIDGSWANLGSTAVDMSSYYNKTQIDTKLEDYVTANRLTNKLDDYVEKDKLAKVGKSNSYNDLDDLPEIPDVSGLKPYVETLQDSVNTAPVSKVVYDAVQELNEAIENAGKIDDDATATDSTWSSKKINDSLVDIDADNVNITKEDDTKKSLQAMYEDGELGGGGGSDEYSTEEKVCGKWIDGKPIYRKTFTFNNITIGTTWTNTGAMIPNCKNLIKVVAYRVNWTSFIGSMTGIADTGELRLQNYVSSTAVCGATVEYTKTTD